MKKIHIIFIIFAVAAIGSFIYFYEHPTIDPHYAVNCDYFRRVADVHWAEAKMYSDLASDATSKGNFSDAQTLGQEQFQKQALAGQWESQYQDCKKSGR